MMCSQRANVETRPNPSYSRALTQSLWSMQSIGGIWDCAVYTDVSKQDNRMNAGIMTRDVGTPPGYRPGGTGSHFPCAR